MTLILFALPAFAGTTRLCAATEADAAAHGNWRVLARDDRDEARDGEDGTSAAGADVEVHFGDTMFADLCPTDDPMGGLLLASRGEMLEVSLPGAGGGRQECITKAWAIGAGTASGDAAVHPRLVRAEASGRADMVVDAGNSAQMEADAGGGGRFVGEWSWRVAGPNTQVQGSVHVDADEAYAGAFVEVPGLVQARAWGGRVEGWARRGGEWTRIEGAAPMDVTFDAVLQGTRGVVCARGAASVGALTDRAAGGFEAESALDLAIDATATDRAPTWLNGGGPEFGPCGCQ
ncbi:MAG: hypothetical protein ACOZNI_23920 [Myxococcota bacterium]